MRIAFLTLTIAICLTTNVAAQTFTLKKIWETDTIIAVPESVLPDEKRNRLYVSLIDGAPWEEDGKGGVAVLSPDGIDYKRDWIVGLHAPKGMGIFANRLYVADTREVVVIDINRGVIEKRIAIDSAKGLNDITITSGGVVFVSDSRAARIWRIEKDRASLFLDNIRGVNGLKAEGETVLIGAGRSFVRSDMNRTLTKIADLPQGIDGIEPVGNGGYLLTSWGGYIFYVSADGNVETILETHAIKKNTADIGFDPRKRKVYVPTFNAKKVEAYQLEKGIPFPKVLAMDARPLSELKKGHQQKDSRAVSLITQLRKQADSLLQMKPLSVMDKAVVPVSGDKHDYMSQAPYFWYDSSKPKGLPYLRRDGVRNPEINKITDRSSIGTLENTTKILALAWYFTGDEKYAAKTATLLRHWFLDTATKMNPHLEYGQGIPGINHGRGIGIIESRTLIGIADAALLISNSRSWTSKEMKSLKDWYASYLDWMLTSSHGRDERMAKNNHGTWYYAQVIDFALFTNDMDKARQLAEESRKRLDSQLLNDGRQPLELERTNALGYSTMNLRGWFTVAGLAERAGVDLWKYKTPQGASLQTAVEWLAPYALGQKKWEAYQQINPYNPAEFYPLLMEGAAKFNKPEYYKWAEPLRPRNSLMMEIQYSPHTKSSHGNL